MTGADLLRDGMGLGGGFAEPYQQPSVPPRLEATFRYEPIAPNRGVWHWKTRGGSGETASLDEAMAAARASVGMP